MTKKKILVNAYALSPSKGSEYSIGWTTINLLAKKYSVHVLYGVSGNVMGESTEIEELDRHGYHPNIKFVKVKASFVTRNLNIFNSRLGLGFFFSWAFFFYQIDVYRLASKLHKKEHFDVIHQLNPIGFREPGFLWLLKAPFVLGPISGTYILPTVLLDWNNWKSSLSIVIRNFVKWFYLNFSIRIKMAIARANIVITATSIDSRNVLKYLKKEAYTLPEHFITDPLVELALPSQGILKMVWIGSIDARKKLKSIIRCFD